MPPTPYPPQNNPVKVSLMCTVNLDSLSRKCRLMYRSIEMAVMSELSDEEEYGLQVALVAAGHIYSYMCVDTVISDINMDTVIDCFVELVSVLQLLITPGTPFFSIAFFSIAFFSIAFFNFVLRIRYTRVL